MEQPSLESNETLGLTPEQLPRHSAIIMDGNGRWARARDLPRIRGHEEGATMVRRIVTRCAQLGIHALTLYSFSTENWKRPKDEVDFLMGLYVRYFIAERETIMKHNVPCHPVRSRHGLPS